MNAWAPIDLTVLLKRFLNLDRELAIFSFAGTDGSFPPGIESAHGNVQDPTHHRDWVLVPMIGYKLEF
jgi:hypothetical protein